MRAVALSHVGKRFRGKDSRLASAALIACSAMGGLSARANATTYYWDPNGAGSVGGSGTWDPGLPEWSTSSTGGSDVAWPNTTPSTATAVFGGSTAGTVALYSGFNSVYVNSLTFQNNYTLNGTAPSQAPLDLSGSSLTINVGSYNVTINARLTDTTIGFSESGTGTLTLGGDNRALAGTITIGGNVNLSSASAGSALATWNLNGGTLSFNPTLGGTNRSVYLGALSGNSGRLMNSGTAGANDITTFVVGGAGQSAGFSGVISDSAAGDPTALMLIGSSSVVSETLTLGGANTYSGPTTVTDGMLKITGSIPNSSAINVVFPGTSAGQLVMPILELDNASSANVNQIGDATPITLAGGEFEVISTTPKSSETVGNLNLAGGVDQIDLSTPSGSTAVLSLNSLVRSPGGGTLLVTGSAFGSSASLTVANPPATVGNGTSNYDAPIVPFAVGTLPGSSTYKFVAGSPLGTLGPLGYYASTLTAGQNVQVTSSVTATSSVSINSLIVTGGGTLTMNDGVILDLASGALLLTANFGSPTINAPSGTVSFGGREAFLSAVAPVSPFGSGPAGTVNTSLANLSRLTITIVDMTLKLTQPSNTTDSAPVSLNSGTLIVLHDYDLGISNAPDAITFTQGNYATLQFAGTAFSTTKGIVLQGDGTFVGSATLAGPLSGPGNLLFEDGPTTLSNGSNTFTGALHVRSGTLALSANGNNNVAHSSMVLAGDTKRTAATLDASGLTAPGGFVLASGQTLAGFGTVVAPSGGVVVASGATISGGDATTTAGNLTTTGGQVWQGGGTYVWKIDLTNAGTAGTLNTDKTGANWDQLTMSALNVAATSGSPFNIEVQGVSGTGTNAFNPAQNYQWVIANMPASAATGNLAGVFALSVSGLEGYAVPGTFSAAFDNVSDAGSDDLVLTYTAAPEPTSLAFAGIAVGSLLLGRRRRRIVLSASN